MITPTPGRVVYFRPASYDPIARIGLDPLAAHIAAVHSDTLVNLMVIDANGLTWPRLGVKLVQDGGNPAQVDESFCEWMPFQKGQAAKTEALAAQLIPSGQQQPNPAPAPQESTTQQAPPIAPAEPAQQAEPLPAEAPIVDDNGVQQSPNHSG